MVHRCGKKTTHDDGNLSNLVLGTQKETPVKASTSKKHNDSSAASSNQSRTGLSCFQILQIGARKEVHGGNITPTRFMIDCGQCCYNRMGQGLTGGPGTHSGPWCAAWPGDIYGIGLGAAAGWRVELDTETAELENGDDNVDGEGSWI